MISTIFFLKISKFIPLHGAFLPNIKYFGCKTGIQFNITHLFVGRNYYTTKSIIADIVYDLDNWPKTPLVYFILKKLLVWCD